MSTPPNTAVCPDYSQDPDPALCYLTVDSLAFRAWNRGLAAVSSNDSFRSNPATPYGVWRFNGVRWYPDPTFPGSQVCPGTTILWAGKLDAWLIGSRASGTWPTLCRYDGESATWEPLAVPTATVAQAFADNGTTSGTLGAGACFAWNNCWFFGTAGTSVHWDGQSLSNESPGLGASPWLFGSEFLGAAAATSAAGAPFGLAVKRADSYDHPPGAAMAPQLFSSMGGVFQATGSPPALSGSANTDLVGVALGSGGQGWLIGAPSIARVEPDTPDPTAASALPTSGSAPSPVIAVDGAGNQQSCPATPPDNFSVSASPGTQSYLWASVSAVPDGTGIVGGVTGADSNGALTNQAGAIAQVSCSTSSPPLQIGTDTIQAVAANASNDAWAAGGPEHLYRLTDGQTPNAPPGDDNETRPLVSIATPTIFVFPPPVTIPPPPPPTTTTTTLPGPRRTVKLKPALYDIHQVPIKKQANGLYKLTIVFKVRRKVTIGLEAVRRRKVVSSSGLRTFTGRQGSLSVMLSPHAWPTGLKFVLPKSKR